MTKKNLNAEFPVLETERLHLVKVTIDFLDDIYEYASDSDVNRFVSFPLAYSKEDTLAQFFNGFLKDAYENNIPVWAIVPKGSCECVGTIGFNVVDEVNGFAEAGYCLKKTAWGKGYATESLQEVVKYGFLSMDLNRIEAYHFEGNEPSGKVLKKCGFEFEGMMRKKIKLHGRFSNILLYSTLFENFS